MESYGRLGAHSRDVAPVGKLKPRRIFAMFNDRMNTLTNHIKTPDVAKAPDTSERMSRRQFNSFLHKLYGCPGNNDVKAHYVFGGDEDSDYYVEVFLNSPKGGTMIAVHHDPILNSVDVFTYSENAAETAAA